MPDVLRCTATKSARSVLSGRSTCYRRTRVLLGGRDALRPSSTGVAIHAQPDITLLLDSDAVIQAATVSNAVAGEVVEAWLGRPWIETVAASGVDRVQRSLDDALSAGVSAYRRIDQRFPSGLELPIEYTTVLLGESGGLVAVGRNLEASGELESRLIAAQQAMEQDYWKLREAESRYRLLFDASNEAILVLACDDLRVVDCNPAAIRALGLAKGWGFLEEMAPAQRTSFRAMLAKVREGGRVPGGLFHIGAGRRPWRLRAFLIIDDAASLYLLQLAPADGEEAPCARDPVLGIGSASHEPIHASALPPLPSSGKTPLKALVQAAVAVVERHYVESALRITDGNRTAAAGRLGLSRQSLYAKLSRYDLKAVER